MDLYPWIVTLQVKGLNGRPQEVNWQMAIPANKPTVEDFSPLISSTTLLKDIKCLWYKSGSQWLKMDKTTHVSLANGTILIDTIGGEAPSGD